MSHIIATKNSEGAWEHHKVERPIYDYIRQLETYVKHPNKSRLKEVYSERFLDS